MASSAIAAAELVEFGVLGPLQANRGGQPIALGGPRQRRLLTILLVHANQVVSAERLADELWAGQPPESRESALHVHVSRLRRVVERHGETRGRLIVTRPPGYVLELTSEQLDAHRFEDLVGRGRTALLAGEFGAAVDVLTAALSLWRGPALAEFSDETFARAFVSRLDQLRRAALEDRVEAELALGRHAEVVGDLEALVMADPLSERLCGQLVVARYRSGRQVEALEACRRLRAVLDEELGIEPGPELRRLEEAILRHDRDLLWPPHAPVAAPWPAHTAQTRAGSVGGGETYSAAKVERPTQAETVFVGRARELASIMASLDSARQGRGRLVLVYGEAGIGKTRMLEKFAGQLRDRRVLMAWGRCHEGGGSPPFWPWVQALRTLARATANGPRAGSTALGAEIARLVAQLAETGTSAGTDPDTSRFRLFDAVTTAITSAADECLIVIVLDDLHWADQGSLLLLEFMAPAISTARLLVIASYRDTDITRSHPLAHALGVLARSPVTRVALAGLDVEEVARYIMTATGVASDPLAAVIRRKTEGNPFFVHELVALLDDEGRLATGDPLQSWTVAIPPAVRDVINRRCARLSDSAAHLVQVAAIAGPIFRHDVLEAVSGFEDEQLLDAVDEALSEGLIVEDDDQPGSYRFSHDLVCDTVRSELSAMRRARLHGRVGEALEALLNSPMPPQAAEIAYHLMLAAPADKYADKAIRYAVRAAEQATSALAYEDAVAHYERALETWANVPRPDAYRRCELLLALGDARWRAGQAARADSAFLEAVDLARTVDDPRLLAKAVLGLGGGLFRDWHVSTGTANQDRIQLLEQALNALGDLDGRLRVRLLGQLAEELYYSSVAHRRLQLSREAVETAELLGDQWTLAYALCSRCLVTWTPDHLDERLELAAQIAALGEALSSPELMLFGRHYLFVAQTELGDIRAAASTLGAFEQMASELRQPLYLWTARSLRALEALFVGRFAAAERLATEALEMGQRAQVADAVNIFAAQLGMIRREQGRLQEIEPAIRTFVEQFPEAPVWRAALALVAAVAGRSADAQEALDWLARDDFGRVPRDFAWLAGLALLAEVCSILGDQSRATVLYRLLQPFAHRNVMAGDRTCWGAAAHYLGILAATIGRFDEAEQWLQRALDMNRRMGAAPWVARGLYELGRLQLHRAEQPPGLDAATLFDEARELAEQLGMAQLLGKIEHAAASRRSPHAPSHPTARSRP